MNDLPDRLEDFLNHPPIESASPGFRESLKRRTSAELRPRTTRFPLRIRTIATAWAASVLLAFGVGAWWNTPRPDTRILRGPAPVEPQPVDVVPPAPAAAPNVVDAIAAEWEAFDAAGPKRAKLYVDAGRRYLAQHKDHENAIRCYAEAVKESSLPDLQISEDDDLLLMAFKLQRMQKEPPHAIP